ncbi:hypothetical protein GJ688_08495 [Heliobacillus mobilis]|uniref:Uncharacterized protein n=2 Tax=Heliobacterium mobile TaxID=28064 RepID=A0A6I3SJM6_HELMO|nr:hypothetical protein [Heliobacterium mobile]
MFSTDVKLMKTTASGISGRASRLSRVGSMVMPSDRMSVKGKRDYRRPGLLIRVPFDEFDRMKYVQYVQLLPKWQEKYGENYI